MPLICERLNREKRVNFGFYVPGILDAFTFLERGIETLKNPFLVSPMSNTIK